MVAVVLFGDLWMAHLEDFVVQNTVKNLITQDTKVTDLNGRQLLLQMELLHHLMDHIWQPQTIAQCLGNHLFLGK